MSTGQLKVNVVSFADGSVVQNATVSIAVTGEPDSSIMQVSTDISGQTESVTLNTPDLEFSLSPGVIQPYSEYNVTITAPGFETYIVNAAQILPGEIAVLNVSLIPQANNQSAELFVIPPHTLFGVYPPRELESEIKPVNESGEIVLSRVVIPEYVVVHDGPPSDSSANNYYVRYKDYIKNVASNEIYATWPEATLIANILAIQSFTLNRVYTEWYRNRGYDFTITSSTAVDQKWVPERNIYQNISDIVDNIFTNFLSRPNVSQPILTQYCDGRRVICPEVMSQWGSKELGDRGYTAVEILKYYYGDSIYINETDVISGIPSSWPGYNLEIGSRGEKVRQLQSQLNTIATAYPLIPKIAEDGIYGPATAEAVRVFQSVFSLGQTGITDFPTWYKISEIYVGVSKIGEYVR